MSAQAAPRDRSYLRMLAVLLGAATFFEGYDTGIAAIVIPDLAKSFHASTATIGRAASVVNLGALGALLLIAAADRVGRRPLLLVTTALYSIFTGLTATAHTVVIFAAIQFVARAFLITEVAIAITIAAEEFPAAVRGRFLGTLSALGALGLIAVAVAYKGLSHTALGWRGLYLLGTIPMLAVAPLRFKLQESQRWIDAREHGPSLSPRTSLRAFAAGEPRRRLMVISGVLFLYNFATISASAYWTYFARHQRGFSANRANTFLAAAVVLGIPGYILAGRLQDRWGRRRTGTVFLLVGMGFGMAAFQAHGRPVLLAVLALAVFFGLGATPVLSALSSELFATPVRASAVAISRSVAGTLGASAGLIVVGTLAAKGGLIGHMGDSVTVSALALIPAAALLLLLPETAGQELEDIAP